MIPVQGSLLLGGGEGGSPQTMVANIWEAIAHQGQSKIVDNFILNQVYQLMLAKVWV